MQVKSCVLLAVIGCQLVASITLQSDKGAASQHDHDDAASGHDNRPLPTQGPAEADRITSLPGLTNFPKWPMYSGYVDIGGGKEMFYWLVEAEPAKRDSLPLVLWTNGGPGCSGLSGFLSEQGPFRAVGEGKLEMNKHAWNKLANMVFIEQPAGVGFSTTESKIEYGDAQAAEDNLLFVKGLLKKFPQYQSRDFYLSSESYGGHYLPTLALKMVQDGGVPNFKGFLVGNPLTYMPYRNYGQYATFAWHQFVPKPMWDTYESLGCDLKPGANQTACDEVTSSMDDLVSSLDPYALDFPICTDPSKAAGRAERVALLTKITQAQRNTKLGKHLLNSQYSTKGYKPCVDNYMTSYLNQKDVQTAIHVKNPGGVTWGVCNDEINMAYSIEDVNAPMMGIYKQLVAHGGLNILVYSGDDDSVCATVGAQLWIWDTLGKETDKWQPWYVNKQVAGYSVGFPGVRFVTVHGAGHMVPSTQPARALQLFKKYLAGDGW